MKQHGVSIADLEAHLNQPTKEAALRELKTKLFHSKEEEVVSGVLVGQDGGTSNRATESAAQSAAEAKPKAQAKARTAQAKAK